MASKSQSFWKKRNQHLTTIGKEAFSGCTKLSSGFLPAQLETVGDEAFRYCHSLVTLNIPKGIKRIGKKAFADCSELSSVVTNKGACSKILKIRYKSSLKKKSEPQGPLFFCAN